jgi:hypothetical protein
MQWEVIGTRSGKPGKWKVSASSEESARRKASASGVEVQRVVGIGELATVRPIAVSAVAVVPEAPAAVAAAPAPQIIYVQQPPVPPAPAPAAQMHYMPQQNVTVNVGMSKGASGLGVAALVIGIIALLLCWIPFVGMLSVPFSIIGLLLAGIGFIISLAGGRSSVGMPVAGGIICLLAIAIAVGVTSLTGKAMGKAADKIHQAQLQQQQQMATPATAPTP